MGRFLFSRLLAFLLVIQVLYPPHQVFHMPTPVVEPVGIPSEFILLKNMFDPTTETEPDFDIDIKDDVEEECSMFPTKSVANPPEVYPHLPLIKI
ncbi:hypothetical protein TSUD_394990 [Trifolium subterraneum]|uniref:Splicing factor RBM39 linker domain-containing protein n=1 Tax=Trifolium subterraneum TaxID=3900 RepID=A0A2Z6MZ70_TRISU|nr:hypothetical protein TSUD_394990 [Trifolium subterraneum]